MTSQRSSPTVLVARKVVPGREAAFAEWLAKLMHASQLAQGHIAVDVQRPGTAHPDEWMVVYRFESALALDNWMASSTRRRIIEEGDSLILGEPRVQVFAATPKDPGVRMVTSYLLSSDGEEMHRKIHAEAMDQLEAMPGFRDREILEAVPGVQPETVVILNFDDEASLRLWIDSDARSELLSKLDPHIEGSYTTNVLGGFAGWFTFDDSKEPRRWKQALVVLIGLFPVALVFSIIRIAVWPNAPVVLAVLIGNIVGVALLTWVVMPPLTRRLSGWLGR